MPATAIERDLTTVAVRRNLGDTIRRVMQIGGRAVVDAPTASGKTYAVAATRWRGYPEFTGGQPVVQLHATCEARGQAYSLSIDSGVKAARLRGHSEACRTAAGDYDDEVTLGGVPASDWFDRQVIAKGVPFTTAHRYLANNTDQGHGLPCSRNGKCTAVAQWDGLPRDEHGDATVDVIHATHLFAHVPTLREQVNVVFDEQPDFTVSLSQDRIRRMVNAYLIERQASARTWEEWVHLATNGVPVCYQQCVHPNWYLTDPDAHVLSPSLIDAISRALTDEPDRNGRRTASVSPVRPLTTYGKPSATAGRVTVVLDDENTVRTIRHAPDFSQSRSVTGLDAYPCEWLWRCNVDPEICSYTLLHPDERREWRRSKRGLNVVQVGQATRPAGKGGRYFNHERACVLLAHIREAHGDEFRSAVVPTSVGTEVEKIMKELGVIDPAVLTYGGQKSRQDFAGEPVGVSLGCIDPGDDDLADWLAESGLDATPAREKCRKCAGSGCPSDLGCRNGLRRAKGREFDGPDADAAAELLASVRENNVAQAIGRWSRTGEDPATVYVWTDAIPDRLVDYVCEGVIRIWTKKQRAIVQVLSEGDHWTARRIKLEIAKRHPDMSISKRHVEKTLSQLVNLGVVAVEEGTGSYGANVFTPINDIGYADTLGVVCLDTTQTANALVLYPDTWVFAIWRPPERPAEPGSIAYERMQYHEAEWWRERELEAAWREMTSQ